MTEANARALDALHGLIGATIRAAEVQRYFFLDEDARVWTRDGGLYAFRLHVDDDPPITVTFASDGLLELAEGWQASGSFTGRDESAAFAWTPFHLSPEGFPVTIAAIDLLDTADAPWPSGVAFHLADGHLVALAGSGRYGWAFRSHHEIESAGWRRSALTRTLATRPSLRLPDGRPPGLAASPTGPGADPLPALRRLIGRQTWAVEVSRAYRAAGDQDRWETDGSIRGLRLWLAGEPLPVALRCGPGLAPAPPQETAGVWHAPPEGMTAWSPVNLPLSWHRPQRLERLVPLYRNDAGRALAGFVLGMPGDLAVGAVARGDTGWLVRSAREAVARFRLLPGPAETEG